MDLEALFSRPGLTTEERALVVAKAAIANAQWDRFSAAASHAKDTGVPRARLEETLLQAVLFYGFPRVVSAFETLARAWPAEEPPRGGALPVERQLAAGTELFDTIYDDNADAVHQMLRSFHHEFHDFVLGAAYGRVLTRPGLTPKTREILAVGALQALQQTPQLIAHGRGALRFGASTTEVREALISAGATDEEADATIQRIAR